MAKKITIRVDISVKIKKTKTTWVMWNKKFNISGYGKTYVKAMDMFIGTINDTLTFKPNP